MPLPTKNAGEEKNAFIGRCMSDDMMKKEFSDSKQRTAVCLNQYTRRKKTKGSVKWEDVRKGDALGLV